MNIVSRSHWPLVTVPTPTVTESPKDLIDQACKLLQQELDTITDPAPDGVWLIWPTGRKPQLRWEDGTRQNGQPCVRAKTITAAEAGQWEQRRQQREQKHKLTRQINQLSQLLLEWNT